MAKDGQEERAEERRPVPATVKNRDARSFSERYKHESNAEIPFLIAEGEADVMITEIAEAGYYVQMDERLAAPLITEPFTRAEMGILMPKGYTKLLAYVNGFIEKEKDSGLIDMLANKYIYH